MTQPVRLQLSRHKGFNLQTHSRSVNGLLAVNCARPNTLGNPFPTDVYGQAGAVDRFRRYFSGNMSTLELSQSSRADRWAGFRTVSLVSVRQWQREELAHSRGKNLACWCKAGEPCHVDVLLEFAPKCEAVE